MSDDTDKNTEQTETVKKTYRTEDAAYEEYHDLSISPNKLFLPSNGAYVNVFDYVSSHDDERAHLELADTGGVKLTFNKGKLKLGDVNASEAQLYDVIADTDVQELDTVLLRALFSIIWFNLQKDIDHILKEPTVEEANLYTDDFQMRERLSHSDAFWKFNDWWRRNLYNYTIRMYVPELWRYLEPTSNLNKDKFKVLLDKMERFSSIRGVMRVRSAVNGKYCLDRRAVLFVDGYSESTNTIEFHSPYFNRVIEDMLRNAANYKRDRKENIIYKPNGNPELLPLVASSIDPKIMPMRDKRAVALVMELAVLVQRAGRGNPNIGVNTLVMSCIGLREALVAADDKRDTQRKLLKRCFTNVCEISRYVYRYKRKLCL